MPIARLLFSIMTLKAGPQDLPYSHGLLQMMVLMYIASGVVALHGTIEMHIVVSSLIADVIVMLFFTRIVLQALDRKPRFVQTVSAMFGSGAVFHVMAWPLLMQADLVDGKHVIPAGASLVLMGIVGWRILVYAHIFRQALESGLTNAILLSFALFFLSMAVSQALLPSP